MTCNAKVDEDNVCILSLCAVEDVFRLDVAMHNVVRVQVLNGTQDCANRTTGINLGEPAARKDSVE